MEDVPMALQGLRNNWADADRPLVPDTGQPGKRPLRACWRFWAHNPHLHMGPGGDESMARCAGVRSKTQVFPAR